MKTRKLSSLLFGTSPKLQKMFQFFRLLLCAYNTMFKVPCLRHHSLANYIIYTRNYCLLPETQVNESSIVKWGYQDNFKPAYFFTKRFRVHKNTHKQKSTNKTKLSKHQTTKATIFFAHKLLRGRKSFVLRFGAFCVREIFS